MTELLPCPFCGSDDLRQVVHDLSDSDQEPFGYSISCNVCFVDLPPEPTQGGAFKTWNTRATQPVDVEKLKREVCDKFSYSGETSTGRKHVEKIIDHLAASGYLRTPLEKIEGLFDAVSVEDLPPPNTDRECDNIIKRYQDHEAIYGCSVSETLLEAARAYQKASGG